MKRVIIVGSGFGGLSAARKLISKNLPDVSITLIDKKNHHLFQPLLYQVATAGLSPADIAVPIRSIVKAGIHAVEVLMETVVDINIPSRTVSFLSGGSRSYDVLLLACGATHSYFGHSDWEEFAPGLKTIEQATEIRRRILEAFERAESTSDPVLRRELLTFIIVGGGPTGVELAGSIGEISRKTLARDFTEIDPSSTRIILIEAGSRILMSFAESLSRRAVTDLEGLGVTVWTSMRVTEINGDGVRLGDEVVHAKTVIWAAGVQPSPIAKLLGTPLDKLGRVEVDNTLRAVGIENVFVIGDMASFQDSKIGILPGLAPVALQQGQHAALNVERLLIGKSLKEFKYIDKGQMATIGRIKAVSEFKGLKLTGFIAWLAWLVVHIYYLVGFRSKIFVLMQWASSFILFKRGARLIVGKNWRDN
ncbi:MAG: NAD(P)/FAD-dependent oxidoreductase [Proteobacteria bacterium]|nr:NAD(P)/FAD-dependent oxidoreductase [Pseudomonadota bacterium]